MNYDLCFNLFVKDNPSCSCGDPIENSLHYFLKCPLYAAQRELLLEKLDFIDDVSLNILLYGDERWSFDDNVIIFTSVQDYIKQTHRFDN